METLTKPTAKELYAENGKLERGIANNQGDLPAYENDLAAAQSAKQEVDSDKIGSEEVDRRNAQVDVDEAATSLRGVTERINHLKELRDDNLTSAADRARTGEFVDEARQDAADASVEIKGQG